MIACTGKRRRAFSFCRSGVSGWFFRVLAAAALLLCLSLPAPAVEGDIFDFFAEEAEAIRSVTVSRLPLTVRQSPATVYVVTAEDIEASGAKTLWDALRGVPGVDVMATRTFYGEVSIRGQNRALGTRTLVLLDGRTVLNGPFDSTYWEGIPVVLDEIERIEVVEGPASALYGANAINGVINIITRTPARLNGGTVRYSAGSRRTHLGSAVYGKRTGHVRYKAGLGWRSANRFEDADLRASEAAKFHAFVGYTPSEDVDLSLSGGLVAHDTQFSLGTGGAVFYEGTTGFLRADGRHGDTRLRAFWNRGRTAIRELPTPVDPRADSDVTALSLEHALPLPFQNRLVLGGSFRVNTFHSNKHSPEKIRQNLWALFFEDVWPLAPDLTLVTSGRLDRHPLTGWVFSPRGSLVLSPLARHVFRLSAGSSFRNPTLTESYLSLALVSPVLPNVDGVLHILGDSDLKAERMVMVEAAYTGRFGPVKVSMAGFHYRLKHAISVSAGPISLDPGPPITVQAQTLYANNGGSARAWGGEAGIEASINRHLTAFANASYLHTTGVLDYVVSENGGPAYKANGGFRIRSGGLGIGLWAHRVGDTFWQNPTLEAAVSYEREKVAGYVLINAHIRYAFSGTLKGLTLGIDAFNLMDRKHFEISPVKSNTDLGHNGEIVRRRLAGTVSYRF